MKRISEYFLLMASEPPVSGSGSVDSKTQSYEVYCGDDGRVWAVSAAGADGFELKKIGDNDLLDLDLLKQLNFIDGGAKDVSEALAARLIIKTGKSLSEPVGAKESVIVNPSTQPELYSELHAKFMKRNGSDALSELLTESKLYSQGISDIKKKSDADGIVFLGSSMTMAMHQLHTQECKVINSRLDFSVPGNTSLNGYWQDRDEIKGLIRYIKSKLNSMYPDIKAGDNCPRLLLVDYSATGKTARITDEIMKLALSQWTTEKSLINFDDDKLVWALMSRGIGPEDAKANEWWHTIKQPSTGSQRGYSITDEISISSETKDKFLEKLNEHWYKNQLGRTREKLELPVFSSYPEELSKEQRQYWLSKAVREKEQTAKNRFRYSKLKNLLRLPSPHKQMLLDDATAPIPNKSMELVEAYVDFVMPSLNEFLDEGVNAPAAVLYKGADNPQTDVHEKEDTEKEDTEKEDTEKEDTEKDNHRKESGLGDGP